MNPCPQVLTEPGAEFASNLLASFIKMATTSPILHSLMQNVPSALPNITLFTFPPKSLTPNSWASLAGDRIPVWFRLLPWRNENWLRLHPRCPHCTVGGMACSSVHPAFRENSTDSGARPKFQAGSRGSIFSDSSYSVSSSMMRALSSKY